MRKKEREARKLAAYEYMSKQIQLFIIRNWTGIVVPLNGFYNTEIVKAANEVIKDNDWQDKVICHMYNRNIVYLFKGDIWKL